MAKWLRKPVRDPQTHRLTDWGSVECPTCRSEVDMVRGDTCCGHCGQEFNAAGQALAPRSQWDYDCYGSY